MDYTIFDLEQLVDERDDLTEEWKSLSNAYDILGMLIQEKEEEISKINSKIEPFVS